MSATYLPAAVALVLIVLAGVYAEGQSRALASQAERDAVAERLDLLGARLESACPPRPRQPPLLPPPPPCPPPLASTPTSTSRSRPVRRSAIPPSSSSIRSPRTSSCRAAPGRSRRCRAAAGAGAAAHWPIRVATLLASALIVVPMLRTRRLVEERQRNIDDLATARPSSSGCRAASASRSTPRRSASGTSTSTPTTWSGTSGMDELYGYAPGHPRPQLRRLARPPAPGRPRPRRGRVPRGDRGHRPLRLRLPAACCPAARCATSAPSARSTARPTAASQIVGVNWDVTADVAAQRRARRQAARGRGRLDRQVAVPRDDEPRDPHADERRASACST